MAILLGAAGLAVAVAAYSRSQNASNDDQLRHRITALQSSVGSLRTELSDEIAGDGRDRRTLDQRIAKLRTCVPEIEAQINGLNANVVDGSVYIANNQQVSSYCTAVVYGSGRGD